MRTTPKAEKWAALIEQQERSGLTVRRFAEENALNIHTFYYWRGKLKRKAIPEQPHAFVELAVTNLTPESTIELHLERWHLTVRITPKTDLLRLRQVLDALC